MKIAITIVLAAVVVIGGGTYAYFNNVAANGYINKELAVFNIKPFVNLAAPSVPAQDANGPQTGAATGAAGPSRRTGGQPIRVQTAVAEKKRLSLTRATIGSIVSPASVQVTNDSAGLVVAVKVQDGATVAKGDILVELDARAAEAAVAKDRGTLARDQALLENARNVLSRQTQLAGTNYVTKQALDDATAAVRSAEGTVQLDQAALQADLVTLSNRTIRAPFDGRIGALNVAPGSYIAAGGAIATLSQMSPIEAVFNVPEGDLTTILTSQKGDGVVVDIKPSGPGATVHTGKLTFVDNQIDSASATVKTYVLLDNKDLTLWPGQSVSVNVKLKQVEVLAVPNVAIQPSPNGPLVFVVTKDKTIAIKPVTVALTEGPLAGISSGLNEGDKVVIEGQLNLKAGMAVLEPSDGPKSNKPENTQ